MTREQLEAHKLEKFRRLVRHAQYRSAYYADIIKEHSIDIETCVPSNFPVLTKSLLMENFDRIVTDRRITKAGVASFLTRSTDPNELMFGQYRVLHTSGSSGEIGYFLYAPDEWVVGMTQGLGQRDRRARPRRKHFGRTRIAYYAAIGGHFAGITMVSAANSGLMSLFVKASFFEINSPLPEVVRQLNELQPDVIGGYTTGMIILAEKQNKGLLKISPVSVVTGGETMAPADKQKLQSAFRCPAFNGYGSTEHLIMGDANPDGKTMTLYDSDLIYEIFEDHTLVTNLFNYTHPLIRYHMSDILRPVAQENPRSPFLVISSLVGRTENIPTFLNRDGAEDFIHPISVVELFIPGVTRFQMRLVDKTSFKFAMILDPASDESQRQVSIAEAKQRLRELLDQKLMQNVNFEVLLVDDIPLDKRMGKFKLIIDDVEAA